MKKRGIKRFLEKKAFFLVLILCVLSAAGMYGMYKMEFNKSENKDLDITKGLADLNEPLEEKKMEVNGRAETENGANQEQAIGGSAIAAVESGENGQDGQSAAEGGLAAGNGNSVTEADGVELVAGMDPELNEDGTPVIGQAEAIHFSSQDKIKWPVKGNIIMDFSPDSTIYFATLDQYRCNPAIFIQASVGTEVVSCTDGVVTAIEEDEELGKTLTVDLGDGYQAVYGQLENIQVAQDSKISAGDTIANVSAPSKYFGVEGSHLYFQMLKDGEAINPRAYLE